MGGPDGIATLSCEWPSDAVSAVVREWFNGFRVGTRSSGQRSPHLLRVRALMHSIVTSKRSWTASTVRRSSKR